MIDRKLISKNAVLLTFRLIISTAVSLYTSRIVLEVLGVDNFGVYGLVGGIVALLNLLNGSMSAATSRFITYELGSGNLDKLERTFSTAFWVHVLIAALLIVLGETVGLWFVNTQLNIPAESMYAANWVYQLSLLSAILSITQIPYTACIMAYEKMGIYAYLELGNTILRLVIVYLLIVIPGDKLITYGTLQLIVSAIIMWTRFYCIRHFKISHVKFIISKDILKPMFAFTSWNTISSGSYVIRQQGIAVIINMFFGVALNAAASLANTVTGVVGGLFSNVLVAFQPQIVKNYATGNTSDSQRLMENASVFSAFVFSCVFIPIYLDIDFVLSVWLVEVPEYVSIFIRLTLFSSFVTIFNNILECLIQAKGAIKIPSFVCAGLFLMQLPLIWCAFKISHNPTWSYLASILILSFVLLFKLIYLKHEIKQFRVLRFFYCIVKITISIGIAFFLVLAVNRIASISNGWLALCLDVIASIIFSGVVFFVLAFEKAEREKLKELIRSKVRLFRQ